MYKLRREKGRKLPKMLQCMFDSYDEARVAFRSYIRSTVLRVNRPAGSPALSDYGFTVVKM